MNYNECWETIKGSFYLQRRRRIGRRRRPAASTRWPRLRSWRGRGCRERSWGTTCPWCPASANWPASTLSRRRVAINVKEIFLKFNDQYQTNRSMNEKVLYICVISVVFSMAIKNFLPTNVGIELRNLWFSHDKIADFHLSKLPHNGKGLSLIFSPVQWTMCRCIWGACPPSCPSPDESAASGSPWTTFYRGAGDPQERHS